MTPLREGPVMPHCLAPPAGPGDMPDRCQYCDGRVTAENIKEECQERWSWAVEA